MICSTLFDILVLDANQVDITSIAASWWVFSLCFFSSPNSTSILSVPSIGLVKPKHEAQLKSGQGHIVPFMPLHLLCIQCTQLPQKWHWYLHLSDRQHFKWPYIHTITVNYRGGHGHLWCIYFKRRTDFTLLTQDKRKNNNLIYTTVPFYDRNGELPFIRESIYMDKRWPPFWF